MAPMLRVNRTRSPLAEMSKLLADVAAVEKERVEAVLALHVSLPSPGSHMKRRRPVP